MKVFQRLGVAALAAAVVAGVVSLAVAQTAHAVSFNGGLICSPGSGSGSNDTTVCKFFGNRKWLHDHIGLPYELCSFTAKFDSDPWEISQFPIPVDGGYFLYSLPTMGNVIDLTYNDCPGGDGRVNPGHGDHIAAVYVDQDDHANPDLKLYCITADGGFYGGEIDKALLESVSGTPETDTLVKTFDACSHPVRLYVLTTGEYQLNFGPDAEGHTAVMVFTGLPPRDVYFYDVNLFDGLPF